MTDVIVCAICDIAGCHHIRERALDVAEGRVTVKPLWAVTALVEKPGTIGFRSVQVTGGNENEALGCGVQQIQKLNPGWSVQSPAALRINIEPTPAPSDKIAEAAGRLLREAELDGMESKAGWDCWMGNLRRALAGKGE